MKYCLTIACALVLAVFIAACRNDAGEPAPADTQTSPAAAPEQTPDPDAPEPGPDATPGPEAATAPKHDFRNADWGMSLEEVKASEIQRPTLETQNTLDYTDTVAGFYVYINYLFKNDKLVRAGMVFPEKRKDNNQFVEDYEKLKGMLTKTHGDPVIDEVKIIKGGPVDSSKLADAVCAGNAVYGSQWNLPRTTIRLVLHSIESTCDIALIYSPGTPGNPDAAGQNGHGL